MFDKNIFSHKMTVTIDRFDKELSSLRTGRANTNMLDTIKVDVYGQLMPIDQLSTVSVPEARLISIQVWDKSNISLIESAIQKSELGINPQTDGQIIRLRIPDLKNMGEKRKISIRNIRREANEELKKELKEKKLSEDDNKNYEKNIQKLTDQNIENIEKILIEKEKEISQI